MAAGRSDRHAPPPFHAPRYGGLAMPRRLIAISLGLCLALLAVALPVGPAAGQDLVIAQGADITTLDPTQATQIHNLNLFYNVYDLSLIHISEPTRLLSISYA